MKVPKSNLYKIGEVAKMFNVSISTLCHYEKIGLLVPEFTDSESGYRYYGIKQFERLNVIKYLRVLDLPVKSILDFLQNQNVEIFRKNYWNKKKLLSKRKKN